MSTTEMDYKRAVPTVSILFSAKSYGSELDGGIVGPSVPKRPQVSAAKFGAWLQLQRGEERSLEQVAKKIRKFVEPVGLRVDPSLLFKIEHGRVPSWPMLAALARVYVVPIEEMTARLIAALEFPGVNDLIGPTRTGEQIPLQKGGSVVPATDRAGQLADRLAESERQRALAAREHRTELAAVTRAARELAKALTAADKVSEALDAESAARRRDRVARG